MGTPHKSVYIPILTCLFSVLGKMEPSLIENVENVHDLEARKTTGTEKIHCHEDLFNAQLKSNWARNFKQRRDIKDAWWRSKAQEVQTLSDQFGRYQRVLWGLQIHLWFLRKWIQTSGEFRSNSPHCHAWQRWSLKEAVFQLIFFKLPFYCEYEGNKQSPRCGKRPRGGQY